MNHRSIVALAILLVALLGLSAAMTDKPEPVWEQQVAAVRRGETDAIHVAGQSVSDAQFDQLRGLSSLRALKLDRGRVSANALRIVADLPRLDTLGLRDCRLGNSAIREIVKNQQLTYLNFPNAEFGDEGLELLAALPHLQQLRFSSPYVTPQGLEMLGQARPLRWLHLFDMPVTGRVLDELATLDQLESLYIDQPHVDPVDFEAALDRFYAARPQVHLHVDQQHHDLDPHRHAHRHPH